jgi:RimJ/RimL family protein N-acetyltransferase
MYVAPKARGNGVGRTLLLEAIALARSTHGVMQINLRVNAGNATVIRLYESVGFRSFDRELGAMLIDGELHDELQMSLRLR